jgi:DNA mismatch repair protein MutL
MPKIKILSPEVVAKICAGEVIERPANVVKELVENAVDAGAKNIEIKFERAGKKYIYVADDGEGMDGEDVKLAFLRHATSKVFTIQDFKEIKTLGFRGEALPSISSVSKVKLISRSECCAVGHEIEIHGGRIVSFREVGCPQGTTVEVRELFFNVPARLKFLKADYVERSHIISTVIDLSLSAPGTTVKFYGDEQKIFISPSTTNIINRISDIFGHKIASSLFEVAFSAENFKFLLYLSKPFSVKSAKFYQFISVNSRPVHVRKITQAIYEAYHDKLGKNEHPTFFLYITCPAEFVDVNVHPSKREIRFQNENFVYSAIVNNVKRELMDASVSVPVFTQESESSSTAVDTVTCTCGSEELKTSEDMFLQQQDLFHSDVMGSKSKPSLSDLKITPIGQIGKTYIVAQSEDGLVIIDQHAASERILYELYQEQLSLNRVPVQSLLEPIIVELSPAQKEIVDRRLSMFNHLGFGIEHFGGSSYVVRAVPAILSSSIDEDVIYEIINSIVENEDKIFCDNNCSEKVVEIIAHAACSKAIKAKDRLTIEEMKELIEKLQSCKSPYSCAHGRPTTFKLSFKDLEYMFSRKK